MARGLALALALALAAARWTPQEDAVPRVDESGRRKPWAQLIAEELDRSLGAFPRPKSRAAAEDAAARMLADPLRSVLVLGRYAILDQRLFVRPNHMQKGILHVEFLRALIEKRGHPNVAYQWEWNADGFKSQDELIRRGCPAPKRMGSGRDRVKPQSWGYSKREAPTVLPRLVIAKRYGYDQCGILVPNCYFDNADEWNHVVETVGESEATRMDLEKKKPQVFWRGAIRIQGTCEDEFGNFARAEAVGLGVQRPDVFDVKCIECAIRDQTKQPCKEFRFGKRMRAALASPEIRGSYVHREDFGRYQYQLNLPGSVSGSYSRNLNHLWLVGSVVAMWDAPYVEFYYPALAEGETHVALDRATAFETLARQTPRSRRDIVATGRRVADELLCPECLENYWRLVVSRLRAHYRMEHALDDPKALRRVLSRVNLTDRNLVALHATRLGSRLELVTSRAQLLALADAALAESPPAKEPAPTNANWNARSTTHLEGIVRARRNVTRGRTSWASGPRRNARRPSRSMHLNSRAESAPRPFQTKMSVDKATGVLRAALVGGKEKRGDVDDDGQYRRYRVGDGGAGRRMPSAAVEADDGWRMPGVEGLAPHRA